MSRLVEMVVESVRVHMLSSRHVVILKDIEGDRYLPIWIGAWEASAIAMKLQGLDAERPITHDLFAATLEALGARIDRIVIGDLAEETYHAQLILEVDGRTIELDARPSDCVALAVRTQTRILVAEEVLDRAALAADPDADDESESSGAGGRGRKRTGVDRDFRPDESTESLGEAVVDERLGMFRDFINSLDKDQGKS